MNETHATPPVFPPGRYGRRRDGRRRLGLPVAFGVAVLVVSVLFAVRLYGQYGDPDYDPRIIGWTGVTDTRVTIDFTVRVPPGAAATCVLRARAYDGSELGRREVTVRAAPGATTVRAAEVVPTRGRTAVGDVVRCKPAG